MRLDNHTTQAWSWTKDLRDTTMDKHFYNCQNSKVGWGVVLKLLVVLSVRKRNMDVKSSWLGDVLINDPKH